MNNPAKLMSKPRVDIEPSKLPISKLALAGLIHTIYDRVLRKQSEAFKVELRKVAGDTSLVPPPKLAYLQRHVSDHYAACQVTEPLFHQAIPANVIDGLKILAELAVLRHAPWLVVNTGAASRRFPNFVSIETYRSSADLVFNLAYGELEIPVSTFDRYVRYLNYLAYKYDAGIVIDAPPTGNIYATSVVKVLKDSEIGRVVLSTYPSANALCWWDCRDDPQSILVAKDILREIDGPDKVTLHLSNQTLIDLLVKDGEEFTKEKFIGALRDRDVQGRVGKPGLEENRFRYMVYVYNCMCSLLRRMTINERDFYLFMFTPVPK